MNKKIIPILALLFIVVVSGCIGQGTESRGGGLALVEDNCFPDDLSCSYSLGQVETIGTNFENTINLISEGLATSTECVDVNTQNAFVLITNYCDYRVSVEVTKKSQCERINGQSDFDYIEHIIIFPGQEKSINSITEGYIGPLVPAVITEWTYYDLIIDDVDALEKLELQDNFYFQNNYIVKRINSWNIDSEIIIEEEIGRAHV